MKTKKNIVFYVREAWDFKAVIFQPPPSRLSTWHLSLSLLLFMLDLSFSLAVVSQTSWSFVLVSRSWLIPHGNFSLGKKGVFTAGNKILNTTHPTLQSKGKKLQQDPEGAKMCFVASFLQLLMIPMSEKDLKKKHSETKPLLGEGSPPYWINSSQVFVQVSLNSLHRFTLTK